MTAAPLNQLFRRFRTYQTESDWVQLVMEGARPHAAHVALFAVEGETFVLKASAGFELVAGWRFEARQAAAFLTALRSKELVTALSTAGEVGGALSGAGKLSHLFPILNGERAAAILFVAGAGAAELEHLELVANMATCALERAANQKQFMTLPAMADDFHSNTKLGADDPGEL